MPSDGIVPQFGAAERALLRECVAFEMANVLIRAQWKGRGTGYQDPRYVALVAVGRKLGIDDA